MDEQAVLGPKSNADSDFRQRALAYFERLKISPDAWQVFKYKYSELTTVQQQLIRETLISWLQAQMLNPQPEKTFIRNKAAQVFALLFVTEYLTKWPKCVPANPHGYRFRVVHSKSGGMCFEVVGAYVSWIDLPLIANDRFISVLLGHMSIEVLREEACDCLFEVVNKGMDPVDKMKLVESLCQVLQSAGSFSIDQEEDVDFLAGFSKLVNGKGQSLIDSWSKLIKNGDIKNAQEALQAIETKVALMLQLLIHEEDDISPNIIGFCYYYLHIWKQLTVLSDQQKANVEAIMLAVMKKLTYDEEYNFENEGEDEAMFVEYRKQLKLLLDRLAQVSPELLVASVHSVFSSTLQDWQTTWCMEVEVAIRLLLYMLAEALLVSHGVPFAGDVSKASALQDMRILVTSRVSSYQHTSVTLEFFKNVVRYEKFFTVEPQHIPRVLMAFLDHRSLRHSSAKVRSRMTYLFSRFVKSLNKQMNPLTEDILNRIQDLLELSPPENGHQSLLGSDDQLFIYETAGVLTVNSEYLAERKQALVRNLLTPLMEKFKILHSCQPSVVPYKRIILRSGVRTFLHRMVICLGEEVFPFIPTASERMLKDCEAEDLREFILLINQITAKFKRQVSPFLQQMFMPLLHAIFEVLLRPAEENDYYSKSGCTKCRVLVTVTQGAVEYPDPIAQKTCFIILSKLVELWRGKDGPVGFADFVYKHIVPSCFLAPLKQTFDLADAQTVLALSECAVTLKTIHLKWGPECVQYLQQEYLPSLQVAPEIIQEFYQALQQPDAKVFKNYLKVFFQRAKPY
uniref:Exportin-T n=1 Tax=Pan troglodytes TaxID=9598 RepID=A0A2I3SD80_PANTR